MSIKVYKDQTRIKYKYKEWLDIESPLPQQPMLTRKKQYVHVVAVSARGIWRDTYHLRGIESSSIGGAQFYWLQSPNIILEKENMKQQPNKK